MKVRVLAGPQRMKDLAGLLLRLDSEDGAGYGVERPGAQKWTIGPGACEKIILYL